MAIYTPNVFDAHPSTISEIYHPPRFSPTIQELSRHSPNTSIKIFNIQSCEIDHKLTSSPTQNMVDIFYRSGKTWQEFVNGSKLSILRDTNFQTFDVFFNYLYLFQCVAFNSFSTYFSSPKRHKFKGNANKIIEQQYQIYNILYKRLQIESNTCLQIDVRIPLTPIAPKIIPAVDPNDDNDDDADPDTMEYNKKLKAFTASSKPQKHNHYKPNPANYNSKTATFNLSDYNHKIGRIMQDYFNKIAPLNMKKPFSYKQIQIVLNENEVAISNTNANVPNAAIECNQSLNMILNSVNSYHNMINTLTFLYIVYNHCIMVYAYITNADNKAFGCRIFEKDLVESIPRLFQEDYIDIHVTNDVKHQLQFKKDTVYNEYKTVLLRHEFDIKVKQTVNALDINPSAILDIFQANNMDKDYFADGKNRKHFLQLLEQNGFVLGVANALWHDLGGVNVENNVDMKEENDMAMELYLDALASDIMAVNDGNVLKQRLIQALEVQNGSMNELLECYGYINGGMRYEDPPW